jgi:transposase
VTRDAVLTDVQWSVIEPLLPCSDGVRGRPFRDHRQVIEGIVDRYRCGIAWRDLPADFGPWQTVWKRHRQFAGDGTWDAILTMMLAQADAEGGIDWSAVDSTICRVHQHGASLARHTGGTVELHEFAR